MERRKISLFVVDSKVQTLVVMCGILLVSCGFSSTSQTHKLTNQILSRKLAALQSSNSQFEVVTKYHGWLF